MSTKENPIPGYETIFVSRSEYSDEGIKAIQDKIKAIVTEYSGESVHQEDWGRRKLAYPIQKETRGHYSYMVYSGKPGVVAEIERNLRISEHVLRFLTVNLESEFNGETFKKQRSDAQAAAKRREEEREARREESRRERYESDDMEE